MQLFLLALVLGIVAHDWLLKSGVVWPVDEVMLAVWIVGTKGFLAGSYALWCHMTLRDLDGEAHRLLLLRFLDRFTSLYRPCVVGLFFTDLAMGGLLTLRNRIGDLTGVLGGNLIVLDEILTLFPSLLLLGWAWWCYYPIDRRLREASLIRRIDAGMPIHPIGTRRQFVVAQFRHQVMILVPILLLITWNELVESTMAGMATLPGINPTPFVQLAGAACIVLFTPIIIRHLWDTTPLPEGEMRQRLMQMCRQHRVGVRELLLWRTFGGMINAAVMGLVRPLRFILLTDGLLEQVPQKQVEAIMAHELAHVRRHHMFWLLTIALILGIVLTYTWHYAVHIATLGAPYFDATVLGGTIVSWIIIFGWVSRRLERQADTFAVQHIAYTWAESHRHIRPVYINESSVNVLIEALQCVAELNQIQVTQRSWRHGSIDWRQRYLRNLTGQSVNRLGIDRQILWIKILAGTAAGLLIVIHTIS